MEPVWVFGAFCDRVVRDDGGIPEVAGGSNTFTMVLAPGVARFSVPVKKRAFIRVRCDPGPRVLELTYTDPKGKMLDSITLPGVVGPSGELTYFDETWFALTSRTQGDYKLSATVDGHPVGSLSIRVSVLSEPPGPPN